MNLLFLGHSPTLNSPSTDALKSIINQNIEDEIFYLYLGEKDLSSDNHINYIHYSCILDRYNLFYFLKKGKLFTALFKKILNKIIFYFKNYNYFEYKASKNKIKEIIKKKNIDKIIVFESFTRERSHLFLKYLNKIKIKSIIYWIEMPVNKHGKFDKKYFDKVSKNSYKSCVHSRYSNFVKESQNISFVEYPIITLDYSYKCVQKNKVLIYIGRLYKDIRNPKYLFSIMEKMHDYKLIIYGSEQNEFNNVPHNVFFKPFTPLSNLYSEIANCSALVCIENSNLTDRKTSKLANYIPFKKPIIDIMKNFTDNPSLDLTDYKYGFCKIYESNDLLKSAEDIKYTINSNKKGSNDIEFYSSMFPSYIFNQFKNL